MSGREDKATNEGQLATKPAEEKHQDSGDLSAQQLDKSV